MEKAQIEYKGITYSIGTLSALEQLHVNRRLAPLMIGAAMRGTGGASKDPSDMIQAAEPILTALSVMSNEDVEYIIFQCLSVCKRKAGDKWVPIVTTNKRFMDETMSMFDLLKLTSSVIEENLGNFLEELRLLFGIVESEPKGS